VTDKHPAGNANPLYQAILDHLRHAPWNDIRNARTLAWMITGLIETASSHLSHWITSVHSPTVFAQSTERRFKRWLANPHLETQSIYAPLITQALKSWGSSRVVLVLDTSLMFEQYCQIRIALLYRGRAVALVWKVLEHANASVRFDQFEALLEQAQRLLNALGLTNVVFLADRGFADVSLFERLREMGWHYRIRITSNLILFSPNGQRLCKAGEVQLASGSAKFYQNVRLTATHYGLVHVALGRPKMAHEKKDYWFVVSDQPLSLETFIEYGWRFQIEQGFKDDQSAGFQLQDSRLRSAMQLERLLVVMALAGLLLVCQGQEVVAQGVRRMVDAHWTRGLSYLRIGWCFVRRARVSGLVVLSQVGLVGGSDPEPLLKRRRSGVVWVSPVEGWSCGSYAFRVLAGSS
jgi:Transposase DDE domain